MRTLPLLLCVTALGCIDVSSLEQPDQQANILPAPPRLGVDDALRAACPFLSDAEIRDLLEECEYYRLMGLTEQQQLDAMLLECMPSAAGRLNPCQTCAVAVLRQIYDL